MHLSEWAEKSYKKSWYPFFRLWL